MSDTIRDALAEAIRRAINTNSAENASNTPDYILAQFLGACLAAFNTATQQRETWYGRDARPSSAALAAPPAPSVPREATEAMYDAAPDPTAAQPDDVERWGNADTDEIGRKSGWHQRTDGYWTPWHIAADAIDALRAERDALECANASLNVEVDRLYACRNELQEVTRTMNDPTINIIHTLNEAVHSLRAERDALREALQAAAKAMNDECLYYAQYGEQPPQHLLDALDAARAKVPK